MQNSTSSNNSQNPAPTDNTPIMSGMSEECDDADVWTCDETADYLCKRVKQAFVTLMSAESAYGEAVEDSMSINGGEGDAEDGDGDRSRTQGTLEGLVILTKQAYHEAAEHSMTASARCMSHHAAHPDGSIRSLGVKADVCWSAADIRANKRVQCDFLSLAERQSSRREHSE